MSTKLPKIRFKSSILETRFGTVKRNTNLIHLLIFSKKSIRDMHNEVYNKTEKSKTTLKGNDVEGYYFDVSLPPTFIEDYTKSFRHVWYFSMSVLVGCIITAVALRYFDIIGNTLFYVSAGVLGPSALFLFKKPDFQKIVRDNITQRFGVICDLFQLKDVDIV